MDEVEKASSVISRRTERALEPEAVELISS